MGKHGGTRSLPFASGTNPGGNWEDYIAIGNSRVVFLMEIDYCITLIADAELLRRVLYGAQV